MNTDREDIINLCAEVELLGGATFHRLKDRDDGMHHVSVNWNGDFIDLQSRSLPRIKGVLTEIKRELSEPPQSAT